MGVDVFTTASAERCKLTVKLLSISDLDGISLTTIESYLCWRQAIVITIGLLCMVASNLVLFLPAWLTKTYLAHWNSRAGLLTNIRQVGNIVVKVVKKIFKKGRTFTNIEFPVIWAIDIKLKQTADRLKFIKSRIVMFEFKIML